MALSNSNGRGGRRFVIALSPLGFGQFSFVYFFLLFRYGVFCFAMLLCIDSFLSTVQLKLSIKVYHFLSTCKQGQMGIMMLILSYDV